MQRMLVRIAALTVALVAPAASEAQTKRPNVLIIVADDLGFSDLGAFGGEIPTPHLDALAYSGLRLAGFHTASACSPTRAMLLTGSDNHRVGLGAMSEVLQDNQRGRPGYEGVLRADTATLAERLLAGGYRTMFVGKWHLGERPDQDPHARGFQRSFAMLRASHDHFGAIGESSAYRENGKVVSSLPADFYSSDYFATKLIEQLKASKASADGEKPFFAYLAFTAPHAPLQAPLRTIAKYKGRYDQGYEVLRSSRMRRQQELGLLDPSVTPHRLVDTPPWVTLSADAKRISARTMEIYAAMVDHVDQSVGRIVAALKASGEFDNTDIFFLSDNGAEPADRSPAWSIANLEKMGATGTSVHYGTGWAQASTAPSWRFKTFETEGGTRAAAFVSGPIVKRRGAISKVYTRVTDIVPTVLDIAKVPAQPGRFAGRNVPPIDGLTWASLLANGSPVYPAQRAVGSQLFGSRALRQGDWKLVDLGDGRWRLFNVATDPGETRDLSSQNPGRMATLLKAWEEYSQSVGGVLLPDPPLHPNPPKDRE